jgi:choline monooxygenase
MSFRGPGPGNCRRPLHKTMFQIDPDIRCASTLPAEFYTNEKYFDLAREKIFARSWHLLASADQVANLKPAKILDTPLLLARQGEHIHCFSNVCTHRGAILVENACTANGIRCRYHGRRFDLAGKFLSMPEFAAAANFPSTNDDLPRIPHANWEKLIFASLSPAAALDEFLGEMKEIVNLPGNLQFAGKKDYWIRAHWALYCENYLEGFHVPFVHQGLNEVIDYGTYTTETFRYSSLQTAYDGRGELAARYFFIFPNLMFNFYPWGISVNIVRPVGPAETTVTYWTLVADQSKLTSGAGADLETVELEDQAVVESVQQGISSRLYDRGRYSPTREQGTHHFHRLICEFMS